MLLLPSHLPNHCISYWPLGRSARKGHFNNRKYYELFFLIFGGHDVFLWGHWYPCFGLQVMSPLGFKAKWAALFTFGRGVHVTHSLRFTSGATPANLLAAQLISSGWAMPAGWKYYKLHSPFKISIASSLVRVMFASFHDDGLREFRCLTRRCRQRTWSIACLEAGFVGFSHWDSLVNWFK